MIALAAAAEATNLILYVVSGLGLLGGIGLAIKAVIERNSLNAKAGSDNASASAIVAEAARELIDPLRRELAQERAEHSEEIEDERKRVAHVRKELDAAINDVTALRAALRRALQEVEMANAKIRALEEENRLLKSHP